MAEETNIVIVHCSIVWSDKQHYSDPGATLCIGGQLTPQLVFEHSLYSTHSRYVFCYMCHKLATNYIIIWGFGAIHRDTGVPCVVLRIKSRFVVCHANVLPLLR